jgi:uncharacterized protein
LLTAELFVIPLAESKHLVFAPLRNAAFIANGSMVNRIVALRDGGEGDESLIAFLRELNIVDAAPEIPPVTTFEGQPEPTAVTLFLTTACNLRCTYCYASAGDTPARFMSLDVAKRGIDFVSANAARKGLPRFDVGFHGGGEPSVNWRVMTEAAGYARVRARDLGMEAYISSASNGFLNDEQVDWVIRNLQSVSLSFDGLPEVQDMHRPTAAGETSSGRVIHTIRRLDAAAFPYGLRVTVTADQIARLPESIRFICSNFNTPHILVEPSYQLGRWKDAPSSETSAFIDAYRQAQSIALECGREIRFSGARLGMLGNHFCGVTQDTFSLSPDGNVSACLEVFAEDRPLASTFFYGRPDGDSGYLFDLPVLNHLRSQSVEQREFCKGCFAKWSCGGDCYHKARMLSSSGEFEGSDRCHIIRELTKDQILSRIAASGGVVWSES